MTEDQKNDVFESRPEMSASSMTGMYASIGNQYCVFGSTSARHDDYGYPAAALSQDLNCGDMVGDVSNYNWFSVCCEMSDRSDTYANPYMRWAMFYSQIALANEVISSVSEDATSLDLLSNKAQAKAVRSFDYLSLAPYFQYKYVGNEDALSVPIADEQLEDLSAGIPRATQREMYAYILEDLTEAIEIFEMEGIEARTSKNQVDINVAYGLRARANLYMENWADAAADAAKAMEGYTPASMELMSTPGFCDIDEAHWMWGIIINSANLDGAYPSWPAQLSSFSGDAYSTGVACYKSINSLLFNKIPTTDVRRGWWVDENYESNNLAGIVWDQYTGNEIPLASIDGIKEPYTAYTNVKFGMAMGIGNSDNAGDWCLMRVEEMILIQAEGLAMAGDIAAGKAVLESFIQTYRDSSYSCAATTASDFQNEVWFQRRVELWGEGFALADVMRLGKNIVRYTASDTGSHPVEYRFNVSASDPWLLQRIPQTETNSNSAIIQNTGGTQPLPGDGAGLTDGVLN